MRQQLHAQRLDALAQFGEALFHSPETLLILSESSIDALESLEHLAPYLLQPDHGGGATANCMPSPRVASYLVPVTKTVRDR